MNVTEELETVEARLKAIALEEKQLRAQLREKMNAPDGPEMWTIKQASMYLSIPEPTAYYLAQRGQLPGAFRIGGRWRVKADKIREMSNAPVVA